MMRAREFVAALLGSYLLYVVTAGCAAAFDSLERASVTNESETFLDRGWLSQALLADEQAEFDDATAAARAADTALAEAQADLRDLRAQISGLPAGSPERAALEADAAELEERIENDLRPATYAADVRFHEAEVALEDERALVSTQVRDLPEDTLLAFSRALNNAINSGLIVDIDSEHIQAALDGAYDRLQIRALVKALEEEAKFARRARFFTEKAEATGDQRFLEKAERLRALGEARKEQFMERIARYDVPLDQLRDDVVASEVEPGHEYDDPPLAAAAREVGKDLRQDAREAARAVRDDIRETVKDVREEAREVVRDAREEARDAAKAAARDAREEAREAATTAARDARAEAREEAREEVREAVEDAREAAGETTKEAAREAIKD
ncbi:MAG: hypothetical protein D6763_06925 [Alphaproteobacteria bacterium]|nr:MAG: hypothetical protein D6763_06925 [Alphaproteobacteria bacterium]